MIRPGETLGADDAFMFIFTASGIELDEKKLPNATKWARYAIFFAGGMKLKKYPNDKLVEEHEHHSQWNSI
ncbi:hypothetical protein CORC01_00801 [Colletotrichum orchidophilum]|uniref:Uncharacterized protein n=1 Tax=Colletotrichum orchidophilum TaxID=1209926 RepID=A0A1G4BR62_9PEZI|nr:uncharacterized protein CORC01_00801 [Colletotrichum orchidophilum]OHF03939.1 hypothetical protein CORC01_00801 [Colletotrichum orchidophilum]